MSSGRFMRYFLGSSMNKMYVFATYVSNRTHAELVWQKDHPYVPSTVGSPAECGASVSNPSIWTLSVGIIDTAREFTSVGQSPNKEFICPSIPTTLCMDWQECWNSSSSNSERERNLKVNSTPLLLSTNRDLAMVTDSNSR